MKFSQLFSILATAASLFVCGVTYADTCYDPNYNSYYNCGEDEYIAPVVGAVIIGAVLSNDDDGYHHGYHGGGHRGGHGGHGRHR